MLFQTKIYAAIGIAFAIVLAIGGIYYKVSQSEIAKLNKNIATIEISLKTEQDKTKALEQSAKQLAEINKTVIQKERQAREQMKKLSDTLAKLNNIDPKKATLLERKINKASKERGRCLELATGAQPLKDESNAVCPHLLKK